MGQAEVLLPSPSSGRCETRGSLDIDPAGPFAHAQTTIELHVFDDGQKRRIHLLPNTPRGGSGGAKRQFIIPLVEAYHRADRNATGREY
jgi:hypothetical protein